MSGCCRHSTCRCATGCLLRPVHCRGNAGVDRGQRPPPPAVLHCGATIDRVNWSPLLMSRTVRVAPHSKHLVVRPFTCRAIDWAADPLKSLSTRCRRVVRVAPRCVPFGHRRVWSTQQSPCGAGFSTFMRSPGVVFDQFEILMFRRVDGW